jgi:putative membrane protein
VLAAPWVAWLLFLGTIALSHLPRVFDFALANSAFHEGEHMLFLSFGLLFWSRAIDSPPFHAPLGPGRCAVYFACAIAAESVLSLIILAAHSPLYEAYESLQPRPDGLSALADQQFGAGIMFEPASIPLLVAMLWGVKRWVDQRTQKQPSTPGRTASR